MPRTLSKSDFKLACTCITKLYYREHGYPDTRDDNEYLAMLAEGGYMVEQLARLRHPEGIAMPFGGDPAFAAAETTEHLRQQDVTLFEATLLSGRKQARVDILRKRGNRFDLIEVKSKSLDLVAKFDNPAGPFRSKVKRDGRYPLLAPWIPYLEDVTFQVLVLQELYPDADITPHLLLVDTSRETTVEGLPAFFDIRRDVEIDGRRRDLDVRYTGDPDTPAAREILVQVDVSAEVAELMPSVVERAARFVALYADDVRREQEPISYSCSKCEYRLHDASLPNGWRECWAELANPAPHIFDLYMFGNNKINGERLGDVMIGQKKTRLLDVDSALLIKKDGTPTAASVRQIKQLECAETQQPWASPQLRVALDQWQWPLHFIDFETSAIATPYHAGMRPYEMVGFQWSAHSFAAPDAPPAHREWLNTHDTWPCLEFVETLRGAIGDSGTVLMWTAHEQTTLKKIYDQMMRYEVGSPALRAWIDTLVNGRLVDMNRVCLDTFMHPGMGGRTSIKVVLDALWKADAVMRQRFADWMGGDAFAVPDDSGPYRELPTVTIDGVDLDVSEGTGAMRAYQAMLYGAERHNPAMVEAYRDLLLRYCKLDTMAMVLIWDHWRRVG
jgi:hypothetical protein